MELPEKDYPSVETKDAVVASTSVTLVAELMYKGNGKIVDYGFILESEDEKKEYSISETNEINDFEKTINAGLKRNTHYSYKAYIKTEKYLVLGNEMGFYALGNEPPTVESMVPAIGFDGTEVRISGKNFGSDKIKRRIYVNDREAWIIDSGDDYISFVIPSSSFVGEATIRIATGENEETRVKFTILGPEIESISPLTGYPGDYIVISGKYLIENEGVTRIYFGDRFVPVLQMSIGANHQTSLTVAIPPGNAPFSDILSTIKLQDGEKIVQYESTFLTKSSWISRTPEQFEWAYEHNGFSYNGKGYIMNVNTMNFHEYNPLTDKWTIIEPVSSKPNFSFNSLLICSGDRFYKVGGQNYLELNDELWYFKLSDRTWNKINKLPFEFQFAKSFKLGNNIYILTDKKELWLCNFENENYRKLNNFSREMDMSLAASFVVDNTAYITTLGKTWQYNVQNDSWSEKASYPFYFGLYYSCLNGFTYKGYGYIHLGGDIYKYDPSIDFWILASYYPDKRPYTSKQTTFTIDGRPYLLTTYDSQSPETFMFEYHTE